MITPEQSRAARGWLDWSQEDLAQRANVSLSTVRDFEKGRRTPIGNNLLAIEQAIQKAGVQLLSERGEPTGIAGKPRITERDLMLPALDLLAHMDDGFFETSSLITLLELGMRPEGEDAEILANRSDTKFSQIVRNMISHRKSSTNLIGAGFAIYDEKRRGLTITDEGRRFLTEHASELPEGWRARVQR